MQSRHGSIGRRAATRCVEKLVNGNGAAACTQGKGGEAALLYFPNFPNVLAREIWT
jgi:hypothetical protein